MNHLDKSNGNKLLSAEDSAKLAGISTETLKQYKDFGLLECIQQDNKPFYNEAQIRAIFFLDRGNFGAESPGVTNESLKEEAPQEAPNQTSKSNDSAHYVPSLIPAPYHLLEMNQNLREQIEILKEERNWLRQRLEKLETRSEREQMLLLAESETVRALVSQRQEHTKKRVSWFSFTKDRTSNLKNNDQSE